MMPGYNWMHGFGWGGLGWILGLVITLGLIVGFALLVVWLVRSVLSRPASSGGPGTAGMPYSSQAQPTAREILQARYARGEISREEYQQMLIDIG